MKRWPSLAFAFLIAACGHGSTGSSLVSFQTVASGVAATNGLLTFTSGRGAQVTLTKAKLHIGAIYLNQSVPVSGAASEPCISPGTYVAEVFGPVDVDLLSSTPIAFPKTGEGTETQAKTAEIWLTGGDVNADQDATVILDVAGTAVQDGVTYPFVSSITISSNRKPKVTNPALPGANPICHQRIVTPIAVDLKPSSGHTLSLAIDPRPMFNSVDFSLTTKVTDTPLLYRIADDTSGAGGALYKGLIANFGVYQFSFK